MHHFFEEQYVKHEKSLFLVAIAYVRNTEDAKDILQDAAISAYLAIDKLKNKEFFKTWITRIVINKCKNFLKRRKFTEELTDNLNVFSTIDSEDIGIMNALCRMDPEISVYITLKFYNNMTYDEMAKSLVLPVSTVKYRTKNALKKLKELLEGDGVL